MFTEPSHIVSIDRLIEDFPKVFTNKVKITITYRNFVRKIISDKVTVLDSINEWDLLVALADSYTRDNELIRPRSLEIEGLCRSETDYLYYRKREYDLEMTSRKAYLDNDLVDTNISRFPSI